GGHAHKRLQQFIIAALGSFDVLLDDGTQKQKHHMNRSYYGLYVPRLVWREIDNFSSGSVCLVLASDHFDEADYIRHYADFIEYIKNDGAI
ncbi:MAG: FdtA/QdtA family cupin domain-containing protein, partial [Halobacteriota archaeon]